MLILVTGATGFIGGHTAAALVEAGHSVRATVRISSRVEHLEKLGVELRVGSLSDSAFLRESCEGIDVVMNLAGRLGGWDVRQEELRLANVAVVKKLICAAEASGAKQFIQCSTPGVVGMVGIAAEDAPYNTMGEYERTKREAEEFALSRNLKDGLAVTVARPDFVYGPGDLHKLKMFQAIRKRRFPLIGGGGSLLHPTHVRDVAGGLILMLERTEAFGHVFNIAGPRPVTVREMVSIVVNTLNVKPPRISVPTPVALGAGFMGEMAARLFNCQPPITRQQVVFFTRDHASDITRAKKVLGYEPLIKPEDGIASTIAWYRQEGYI